MFVFSKRRRINMKPSKRVNFWLFLLIIIIVDAIIIFYSKLI